MRTGAIAACVVIAFSTPLLAAESTDSPLRFGALGRIGILRGQMALRFPRPPGTTSPFVVNCGMPLGGYVAVGGAGQFVFAGSWAVVARLSGEYLALQTNDCRYAFKEESDFDVISFIDESGSSQYRAPPKLSSQPSGITAQADATIRWMLRVHDTQNIRIFIGLGPGVGIGHVSGTAAGESVSLPTTFWNFGAEFGVVIEQLEFGAEVRLRPMGDHVHGDGGPAVISGGLAAVYFF